MKLDDFEEEMTKTNVTDVSWSFVIMALCALAFALLVKWGLEL